LQQLHKVKTINEKDLIAQDTRIKKLATNTAKLQENLENSINNKNILGEHPSCRTKEFIEKKTNC